MVAMSRPGRGRSIAYELIDHARVFGELSHEVTRLIDDVAVTSSKLASPRALDALETQHFSVLASHALKNAQRSSATCKHIDAVIVDSVDRIRQSMLVMEQAGAQMLEIIDSVVRGAEVTVFSGGVHQPAGARGPVSDVDDDDSDLLLQESALAVQDLKCWALVLRRNLQALRLSGQDQEDVRAARSAGDGTRG